MFLAETATTWPDVAFIGFVFVIVLGVVCAITGKFN